MAAEPVIDLSYEPAGPDFHISSAGAMPQIKVVATLRGATANSTPHLSYAWSWKLEFDGNDGRVSSPKRKTQHDHPEPQVGAHPVFTIPFRQIRGGALTVTVKVTGGGLNLTATSSGLRVLGTNPTPRELAAYAPTIPRFRKLLHVESARSHKGIPRQFLDSGLPLLNEGYGQDGALVSDGGVGMCQITKYPDPTPDDIWSWKANLDSGLRKWKDNLTICRKIRKAVQDSPQWAELVTKYNQSEAVRLPQLHRMAMADRAEEARRLLSDMPLIGSYVGAPSAGTSSPGVQWPARPPGLPAAGAQWPPYSSAGPSASAYPPASPGPLGRVTATPSPLDPVKRIEVELPEMTQEQLEREVLRLYNGRVIKTLYEHRPKVDPRTGLLIVTRVPGGNRVIAQWEQVSAAERIKRYNEEGVPPGNRRGSPDYVDQVERAPGF